MFTCRACKSVAFRPLWKLRDAPYGDLFRDSKAEALRETVHSFVLGECIECQLLQLEGETNLQAQYDNYLYQTNVTTGLSYFYERLARDLKMEICGQNMKVIDIGSNDGSFLTPFLKFGFEVLGIEPAQGPVRTAEQRGIKSIRDYFTSGLADFIARQFGNAGIVSANYTLANVPDIHDFLVGAKKLLAEDGFLSIVTGYHPDQFSVNMWDYIGHDHLSYFSLETLSRCMERAGLVIVDAARSDLKGGSLRVLARHADNKNKQASGLKYMKQREQWLWPENISGIAELKTRIEEQKVKLTNRLSTNKKRYLGIGASISTSYLVNEFQIANWIEFLVDDDPVKISKFSPRFGIPVLSFNDSRLRTFEYAIILAWQHTDVLIERLVQSGFKGKVLIPLPKVREISLI